MLTEPVGMPRLSTAVLGVRAGASVWSPWLHGVRPRSHSSNLCYPQCVEQHQCTGREEHIMDAEISSHLTAKNSSANVA